MRFQTAKVFTFETYGLFESINNNHVEVDTRKKLKTVTVDRIVGVWSKKSKRTLANNISSYTDEYFIIIATGEETTADTEPALIRQIKEYVIDQKTYEYLCTKIKNNQLLRDKRRK